MRKYSCESKNNDYRLYILKTGIVGVLIKFLRKDFSSNEKLKSETLWLICNIMSLESNVLELFLLTNHLIVALFDFIDFSNNENFQQVKKNA